MEKGAEVFNTWTKTQAEFMEKWLGAQKQFVDNWMEATKNIPFTGKGAEAFDAWVKPQKDLLDNWSKSQKEFFEKWMEGTKSFQKMFMNMSGIKEGTEAFKACDTWLAGMMESFKSVTDGMMSMQDTWRANVDKQIEMSKEMVKKFADLYKQEKA